MAEPKELIKIDRRVKLNRRLILPLILIIIGLVNLILMRYTTATIQMLLPTLSIGILDFILSTVSVILSLPALYTLYQLSHETKDVAER